AKIDLTQDLLKTDIPDSKAVEEWVMHYFPKALRKNYKSEILNHRLKREIIATMLANGMVNRMGPTFVSGRMEKCGVSSAEVAKAYIIVREAYDLISLWDEIEDLDNKVPALVQLKAKNEISRMTERAITWFLSRSGRNLNIEKDIVAFHEGIKIVRKNLGSLVADSHKTTIEQTTARLESDGLPHSLAHNIALMPLLSSACDIIRIAKQQKADLTVTAKAYFELGDHFHLDWMRQQARYLPADDVWALEALEGLVDQLYSCQAGITVKILKDMNGSLPAKASVKTTILKNWMKDHGLQAEQIEPLFQELRSASHLDLPMLVIAEQRLRNLYGG
ncbi:MAG: NAD-glutamate dehydrogenase, partial [Pseudomonadota bacterium]